MVSFRVRGNITVIVKLVVVPPIIKLVAIPSRHHLCLICGFYDVRSGERSELCGSLVKADEDDTVSDSIDLLDSWRLVIVLNAVPKFGDLDLGIASSQQVVPIVTFVGLEYLVVGLSLNCCFQ